MDEHVRAHQNCHVIMEGLSTDGSQDSDVEDAVELLGATLDELCGRRRGEGNVEELVLLNPAAWFSCFALLLYTLTVPLGQRGLRLTGVLLLA